MPETKKKITRSRIIAVVVFIVWIIAVGTGFLWVVDYSTRPGQSARALSHLPLAISFKQQTKFPTLLVFLHPQCPCSRATLAELARLVAHNRGRVNIQVLFYRPLDQPRAWVESALWQQASQIPDVTVTCVSEMELLRFGVATSGQTLLYDATGTLVFSGGITLGRGHEGDNRGRSSITNYLHTGILPTSQTPVFGCSILATE